MTETEAFIDKTLAVWQPRTLRVLTSEDARQITENVAGFFGLLLKWDAEEKRATASTATASGAGAPERASKRK